MVEKKHIISFIQLMLIEQKNKRYIYKMLKENIIKMFEKNNIATFEVSDGLDPKTDIILSDSSIENFIKFCNSASKNLVFIKP